MSAQLTYGKACAQAIRMLILTLFSLFRRFQMILMSNVKRIGISTTCDLCVPASFFGRYDIFPISSGIITKCRPSWIERKR